MCLLAARQLVDTCNLMVHTCVTVVLSIYLNASRILLCKLHTLPACNRVHDIVLLLLHAACPTGVLQSTCMHSFTTQL